MEEKLPKYIRNQQIGNRSSTILKSVMQKYCIFPDIDQSQDLGIDYWKQKKDVTFLFLVDERYEQIYWTAPLKEIENKDLSAQDTYTFHVPKINRLDKNSMVLPEPFIFEIIRYYANI